MMSSPTVRGSKKKKNKQNCLNFCNVIEKQKYNA